MIRTTRIAFPVGDDLFQAVTAIAKKLGIDNSELARLAIGEYLNKWRSQTIFAHVKAVKVHTIELRVDAHIKDGMKKLAREKTVNMNWVAREALIYFVNAWRSGRREVSNEK